jgi:multiple sugar transport system permease protein
VNDRVWVGLANYRELFADPAFGVAVANNLRWAIAYLAVPPALGLAFALLLMRALPGAGIVRSLFFMPFVISQVVVGLVFTWFFHSRFGLWGRIAGPLGLPAAPLDTEGGAIWALIAAGAWPQTAYCMILYLAGLAALPREPIEAARVDGARGFTLLRTVVLPLLAPVHFIVAMVCIVSALRSFDLVTIMSFGGPHGSSSVLAFQMVEQTFGSSRYGLGAAIANVLLLAMSAVICALLWRLLRGSQR